MVREATDEVLTVNDPRFAMGDAKGPQPNLDFLTCGTESGQGDSTPVDGDARKVSQRVTDLTHTY